MKHMMKVILALVLSALLALTMIALAEDAPVIEEEEIITASQVEEEVGTVEGTLDDEMPTEEAPAEPAARLITFNFIVGEDVVSTQTLAVGEALIPPEAPQAPEGQVFAGWYIGEARLSEEEPDIVDEAMVADESTDEVFVIAMFVDVKAVEEPAEEVPMEEAPAEEEPAVKEPAAEEPTEEEPAEEEPAEEAPVVEDSVEGETVEGDTVTDETVEGESEQEEQEETDEAEQIEQIEQTESFEEPETPTLPAALDLTYTGEMQALVSDPEDGTILYSLDGETFGAEIPTAINAGEYTVYYKITAEGDAEAIEEIATLTVTIAKADVVLIPPTAL